MRAVFINIFLSVNRPEKCDILIQLYFPPQLMYTPGKKNASNFVECIKKKSKQNKNQTIMDMILPVSKCRKNIQNPEFILPESGKVTKKSVELFPLRTSGES